MRLSTEGIYTCCIPTEKAVNFPSLFFTTAGKCTGRFDS